MKGQTEILTKFKSSLRVKGKRPATIESYQRDAQDFLEYIDEINLSIEEVEPDTLLAFTKHLQEYERHNSIRRKIIGIRQFFRFLADETQVYDSPLDTFPIPERDESLPQELDEKDMEDIIEILHSLRETLKAKRDLAIVNLLAFEGLKATELINLKWSQFYSGPSSLGTLQILGTKGRTIELQPSSVQSIVAYRTHFSRLQLPEAEHLFISFKGRDSQTITPKISRHGLKFLIYELGALSGIKHLNTELLRHYAIGFQLALGKSPSEVMAHFGLRRLGNIAKHVARAKFKEEPTDG